MINIPAFEAGLFRRCREGDDAACREFTDLFWDRHYLWRFGLLPPPTVILPPLPQPDPSPIIGGFMINELVERLWVHEQLLAGLIGAVAGDSSPQPNLVKELLDPQNRLSAAKRLQGRFSSALQELEADIKAFKKR